ncbi:hypothetical protein BSZ32_06570 [Rubritalea profundi]|uniref:Uncharacterized protein n=1 Tax=Rubritalea profundi TaxID=1658618 RepID=A0A2S7U1J9_9BACT|nr:hypothetical protein BSZ32_06570 [Rubritalea profundi]
MNSAKIRFATLFSLIPMCFAASLSAEVKAPEKLAEKDGTFLLIEAEEVTDRFEGHQIHINAINIDEPIKAQHGDSVVETMRNNLRAIAVDAKLFGKPVLAHINHPNFHY